MNPVLKCYWTHLEMKLSIYAIRKTGIIIYPLFHVNSCCCPWRGVPPSPHSPFQGKKDGSAVKPPGHSKAPFVYSYMQTRFMGWYNGKWFISLVFVLKPLIPAVRAIVAPAWIPWRGLTCHCGLNLFLFLYVLRGFPGGTLFQNDIWCVNLNQ